MRVFLAGATGAIGRPLIPKLVAAGHHVTGMTRSDQRAERVRQAGAEAVVADVFDQERLRAAMSDARPDVVVHQLTALPGWVDPGDPKIYAETNRLRTEGTRILLDAARAAGARRMVAQSIAFIYAPEGAPVKSEDDSVIHERESGFGEAVEAVLELEQLVTGTEGIEGLVLRYGFFYGPGTSYARDGAVADQVRKRRFPIVGKGGGVFPFIHVDDAADATVAAVERGAPGIYNVVDEDPAAMRDWLPAYASALGAGKPFRVPAWLARLVAGKDVARFATDMRGASNAKARLELGWEPGHPSWREGFRETLT